MTATIDIIYNVTRVCPHNCAMCCVDAYHVTRRGDEILVRTDGLQVEHVIPRGDRSQSIYDVAATAMQKKGLELSLQQKLRIIKNIDVPATRLDISGGDALVLKDNWEVLKAANTQLGRDFVTLTATGSGLSTIDPTELIPLIGEFNFTFDSATLEDVDDRPNAYAAANLKIGRKIAKAGAKTRAEFPITRATSSPDHVERLYTQLHNAGISKLLLMRLFPSGRGHTVGEKSLTMAEYFPVITQLRALENKFGTPTVKLQCALRGLEMRVPTRAPNPCDLGRESFGLTPLGLLLASPWAINAIGEPSDPEFVLGNLLETPLSEILASTRVQEIRERADENFAHCKIIAERHSSKATLLERMLDKTDPLFAANTTAAVAAE